MFDISSLAMIMHHCSSSGAIDLTVHNVVIDADEMPQIGAGRVLGSEEKSEICTILNNEDSQGFKVQSDRILAKTPYAIAWWEPKSEREILFRTNGKNIIRHTVIFPSMVGIYIRGQLFFAVTKGGKNTRPDEDTKLYRIPLPNLYNGGSFCRGNANLPIGAHGENIPQWTDFVFNTVNTHLGLTPLKNASTDSTDELIEVYAQAEQNGGKFPTHRLLPSDTTLGEWMEKLDKETR